MYSDSTQCDSDSDKSTTTQNKGESEIETKEATKFREAQWETNQEFIPDIDTEFKGTPNPRHELPVSYFNHFMKESMFKLLADSSNTYSIEKNGVGSEILPDEMRKYFGILLHMGIVVMRDYRMYWRPDNRYSPIADVLTRKRFDQMKSCFHIAFNQDLADGRKKVYDRLFKFKQLYDHVL